MSPGYGGVGSYPVAGVVPAAGASRRMGSAKALLTLDEAPFVRHVVSSLTEGGCDPVYVVTRRGENDVAEQASGAGARVLENPEPGDGPITSLRLVLREIESMPAEYVAYLPVDHPRVRPRTVAALLAAAAGTAPGREPPPLVLPVHAGRRGHPALFSRALFPELLDPTTAGGARTIVHRHLHRALLVEVDDPGVLCDVDTPEEYRAVVRGSGRSTERGAPDGANEPGAAGGTTKWEPT